MINLLIFIYLISSVYAHSWIQCSDYRINEPNDAVFFNANNCLGRPRCAFNTIIDEQKSGFGADSNFQFVRERDLCQCYKENPAFGYNDGDNPQARYTPGQRVCLAYPAKNHVASGTTNRFIPDSGMRIFRSGTPNIDTFELEIPHRNGVHTQGVIDYLGFQNCPDFDNNNDQALCTVCFDLENNIPSGDYSFKWTWEFNPGEFYSTCWDATIGNPSNPPPSPPVTPRPIPRPPSPTPTPCVITNPPSPTPCVITPRPQPNCRQG